MVGEGLGGGVLCACVADAIEEWKSRRRKRN